MGGCKGAVRRVSRRFGASVATEEEMRTVGMISWKRKLHLGRPPLSKGFEQADYREVDLSTKTMLLTYLKSSRQNTLYIPRTCGSRCRREAQKPKANAGSWNPGVRPEISTTSGKPLRYASVNPCKKRKPLLLILGPPTCALSCVSRGS